MTTLLTGLFDDAALFPPGNAPIEDAIRNHQRLKQSLGPVVGPFVVPARRLDELARLLTDGQSIDVSVVTSVSELISGAGAASRPVGRIRTVMAEISGIRDCNAQVAISTAREILGPDITIAVELDPIAPMESVLPALVDDRCRLKIRTGGLEARLFPTVNALVHAITTCVQHRLDRKSVV